MVKKFLIVIFGAILLTGVACLVYALIARNNQTACTAEAKLCPDGSAVGRTGPKCEFATCPDEITNNDFKNISYEIEGKTVTLINGISETQAVPGSATKITTRFFGNSAVGDLNNDEKDDIAFILTQDTGGSGLFYYVAVALNMTSGYQGTNAILLGDRIAPQTTEIRNKEIIVNYAERKPGEPMTTPPSVGVSKYFRIDDNRLVEAVK